MNRKPKIAVIRGKYLNAYEMQFYEPLTAEFDITAFGSLLPFHSQFKFPVIKLPSPMDLPEFPFKMQILNRIFIDAQYLFGLENKLKGYDIVHSAETYYHYTIQALNAKRSGLVKKVIATVLENIPFNNESIRGRSGFKKRARFELDHIVALSGKTKESLVMEGANPDKISLISHFVDTRKFQPSESRIDNGADKKLLKILFVGRLEIYKGIYDSVAAFKNILNDGFLKNINMKLMIVGDGSQKVKLRELIQKQGIGKFIEITNVSYDEMPGIYREADIFIAPSIPTPTWQEQYNTALLEAQASGLPIVTTRTGGIPENVDNAAILINPGDIGQLTRAVKNLILNPRLRLDLALKARSRALKVHDIKIGARKLSRLYNSML